MSDKKEAFTLENIDVDNIRLFLNTIINILVIIFTFLVTAEAIANGEELEDIEDVDIGEYLL